MPIYYYDAVNGLDANNGTDPSTPRQTYTSSGSVAGDTYLFKRGTTQQFPAMVTARTGTSDAVRTRYGVYGTSDTPYATFKVASGATTIMNAAFTKYCTFEDIKFDMQNAAVHSLYCASQSAGGQTIGNIIRRCIFTGSASNGLTVTREANSTASGPTGYVIEDCDFYGNAAHGMIILAGTNSAVRRCRFWGNGFNVATGGHGFSSRSLFVNNASLGSSSTLLNWTQHSGNIWKRTFVAPETDAYYVRSTPSAPYHLTRNDATPTVLALNEYGVSGGVLYINIGGNPSTLAVSYAYALCSNLTIEDCESWGNFSDSRVSGTEGHGFAFDDWADTSTFRRNKSYDNEGYGFSLNKGTGNQVFGNIAYNNGGPGVVVNAAATASILHNTLTNNNQIAIHALNGEVAGTYGCSSGVFKNNILKGSSTYGIDTDPADSGHSGTKNCIHGFTTADRNTVTTATVTDDPALDSFYRPVTSSVNTGGTYLGGCDFYAKEFPVTPPIGAVVTFSARSNTNRSIATSRTVATRLIARRAKAG